MNTTEQNAIADAIARLEPTKITKAKVVETIADVLFELDIAEQFDRHRFCIRALGRGV